jgi:5'-3' exonuclease
MIFIISKNKLEQIESILESENCQDDKIDLLLLKKKLEKNSTKINSANISLLLELLDLLNIPYIFSYGEGEYLAVLLNKYNIIDLFLTDDTDPIAAGIIRSIKFYNNGVYYLESKLILEKLQITQDQLCDLCILLGTDYAVFNHGLKPNEIYNLILEFKTIENIHFNNKIPCLNETSFTIINKIRNIYKQSDTFEKNMFLNKNESEYINLNLIIDHNNISYYSNIMLEFWDEFIKVLSINEKNLLNKEEKIKKSSDFFKSLINKHIFTLKFNIKNIIKYLKNNIEDITEEEISNMIISFEYLNKFGI